MGVKAFCNRELLAAMYDCFDKRKKRDEVRSGDNVKALIEAEEEFIRKLEEFVDRRTHQ